MFATNTWPRAARIASALVSMEMDVGLIAPAANPAIAADCATVTLRLAPRTPLAAVADAIQRSSPRLIIPCDDEAVRRLLKIREAARVNGSQALADCIRCSFGEPDEYPTLMTRAAFLAIAQDAGVRAPATRAVGRLADLASAVAEVGLPAVLKADGTYGGLGIAIVRTLDEASAAFRKMEYERPHSLARALARAVIYRDGVFLRQRRTTEPAGFSIQAFVSGSPATSAIACWKGELLAASHADVLASNGGTGPATVYRCVADAEMDEAARAIVSRFRLSGLHGLDFIRDESNAVHLLEINPRATTLSNLVVHEGGDLLALLASRALGRPIQPRPRVPSDEIALFPQEWQRDSRSQYLRSAYHDVPWQNPALVRALLSQV